MVFYTGYAYRPRRLLVGGLLCELAPEEFERFAREEAPQEPVLTGVYGWPRKRRVYFLARGGLVLYCKVAPDRRLDLPAWEVERIDTGWGAVSL